MKRDLMTLCVDTDTVHAVCVCVCVCGVGPGRCWNASGVPAACGFHGEWRVIERRLASTVPHCAEHDARTVTSCVVANMTPECEREREGKFICQVQNGGSIAEWLAC